MSAELQRNDETPGVKMADLSPEYREIMVLGRVLQMSGYFRDVKDQAQAVTKILYGRELGISPINSMSAIHIIEGKPALSSNLLAALIKRSGKYDYRVKEWTDEKCVLVFRQKQTNYPDGTLGQAMAAWEDIGESSFTMDDAKRAGVVRAGGGWSKYPKAMLFARALSQGERTYCPDVSVCALYVPEELGATVNEAGEVESVPERSNGRVMDVPRTTEDIPISRPSGPAKAAVTEIKGNSEPQKAAEVVEPPPPALVDALASKMDADACIQLPKQRAIHRAFKDAIPASAAESTHKSAEVIFREWLKHEGYVSPEGEGSTKRIPELLFDEVKNKAVKFAESLR